MAFATRLPKVRDHREHFNEWTWMCYHETPPLVRVVAHVGDAGQATPHLEHNPLSLLGACSATPVRKLNDPEVARARLDADDQLLRALERAMVKTAKQHDANTLYVLQTVPGIGKSLS